MPGNVSNALPHKRRRYLRIDIRYEPPHKAPKPNGHVCLSTSAHVVSVNDALIEIVGSDVDVDHVSMKTYHMLRKRRFGTTTQV